MLSPPPPSLLPWRHRLIARYCRSREHPARLRLIGWLKKLLGVGPVRVEVFPGVVMELDDRDLIQREILYEGGYERITLALFDRLMGSAGGFLDIGAHHGQYTLRAARALAPRAGRVFALEPTPANATALLRNAALSGLTNLDVCTIALSDTPGILRMMQPHDINSGFAQLAAAGRTGDDGIALHVSVRPFSDLVALVPPVALDVVKIDIEGFEARALGSLFASSARRPRHIITEYRPQDFDYGVEGGLPAWLERHGYRVRTVTGQDYSSTEPLPDDNLWAELRQ